jgi:hypothetical protein
MNKLRLHFAIVVLCCFSFLLLAGKFTFTKAKVDFDAYEKSITEVKDIPKNRLMNIKEPEKLRSLKDEIPAIKNGRIK